MSVKRVDRLVNDVCARRRQQGAMPAAARGFTLIELVVTLVVLSILTISVVPLVRTTIKRQREERLRGALREMRAAIDEFHRDATDTQRFCLTGSFNFQGQKPPTILARSRVIISDCKVFSSDNIDRYPPDLETMTKGVNVVTRAGRNLDPNTPATELTSELSTVQKVYLRSIPVDPITGEANWELRSCYQEADDGSWDNVNVFDVRSASSETALNGEKYSDW